MRQLLISILFVLTISCQNNKEKILNFHLPLTIVQGYGPFRPAFGLLVDESKKDENWSKTYLPIRGIPKNWSTIKKNLIWLNGHQFVYQNYISKNITKENYHSFITQWPYDESKLLKKNIKCYVYAIWGINENGRWMAMVDTNNNLDFSDEIAFFPERLSKKEIDTTMDNLRLVEYEVFQNNQLKVNKIPIIIKQIEGDNFGYNFPQYAKVELISEGKKHTIAVAPDGLTSPNFENVCLIELRDRKEEKTAERNDLITLGQYLTLGGILGDKYRNNGVDFFSNTLQLEGVSPETVVYPLQNGYILEPFSAKEFSSDSLVSTENLKGKYVYIDFWGTWCRGCVAEMPNLIKSYNNINKNKIEFIGVVADKPENLKRFIKKHDIKWPQILSDNTNKLIEKYQIKAFPTTILLDPQGKIIAMNLHADELEQKIRLIADE